MKFQKNSRRKVSEYEKDLVQYWKKHWTFEKSVEQRPVDNSYVFYDGPPFITGVPHHGTLLSSIAKDAIPRYQTMRGKRVERVWGWDCHGLPAEVFTEKKLAIQDKRDIGTKVSLEDYIKTCRENMVQTGSLWEDTIERIGRWVDFRGAYKTMDKPYMESVWWAFKQLYDKGKIYEGEKVLLYCTRDATPISKAEVAMDNSYQEVTDPSVFVKFKLLDDESHESRDTSHEQLAPVYLLAWTTTPWTLPANTAVAVNKDFDYEEVRLEDGQRLILAKELAPKVLTDEKHQPLAFTVERTFKGKELIGKSYEPLFEDQNRQLATNVRHSGLDPESSRKRIAKGCTLSTGSPIKSGMTDASSAHKIWHADYVDLEEGTGIVHLAPAYGEEDFELAKQNDVPLVSNIDDNGFYTTGEWKGQYVWDANKPIAKELHQQGVVWKIEYVKHAYPHCHRCGTKLMYRAHPSWFMDIDGQRTEMLEQAEPIYWFPEHIKHGRWANTIKSAPDWNLSRDRFWATAMPVWKGTDKNGKTHTKVIGSYAELKELSGVELEDYHRPWIDDVTFTVGGVKYQRIEKVMDCWFESGSMPFAQFHYPFENVEKFELNYPGDFIVEYVAQVRAWFYYVHAVNVGLFDKYAFRNVVVTGTLAGNDGRKMSKSFGNFTDPNELMDQYGADSLRFLLLSSPVLSGEDFSLQDKEVADMARKLSMVWNMYDFFTLYADVDGWEWQGSLKDPRMRHSGLEPESSKKSVAGGDASSDWIPGQARDDGSEISPTVSPLDDWIISRVHQLTQEVQQNMDRYDLPSATKPILPFLDDASNWYVRRSRRRFWKSGDDADKNAAYCTLHYVLVRLSLVMAPFTPFLADELFQKLTGGESVHLCDWPEVGNVNELILQRMAEVREIINDGLSQRAAAGLKVRQPLAKVTISGVDLGEDEAELTPIILEELNVKKLVKKPAGKQKVTLDLKLTPELKREGMAREAIRYIQSARKAAGLDVGDRIRLSLSTTDDILRQALEEYTDTIASEALATQLVFDQTYAHETSSAVDASPLTISLEKTQPPSVIPDPDRESSS
jgi:isoleucyl-tRNA synthetase